MPPTPKGTVLEIEEMREDAAKERIRETYADADGALKFFDGYIAQKEKALKVFDAEVGEEPGARGHVREEPGRDAAGARASRPARPYQHRGAGEPVPGAALAVPPLPLPLRAPVPVGDPLGVRSDLRLPVVLACAPPPLQVGRPDPLPLLTGKTRGAEASRLHG